MGRPFDWSFTSIAHGSGQSGRLFHRMDYGWRRVTGAESPRRLLHARQPEAGLTVASKNCCEYIHDASLRQAIATFAIRKIRAFLNLSSER